MPYQPFKGRIPNDRWYCQEHDMWVLETDDGSGELLLGATSFGLFLAGNLVAFTAKPRGSRIERGRGLGTVECRKTVLAVHAPLSFILTQSNSAAEERPERINSAPYSHGWMARGKALDWAGERAVLCDAPTYRAHILSIDPGACIDD